MAVTREDRIRPQQGMAEQAGSSPVPVASGPVPTALAGAGGMRGLPPAAVLGLQRGAGNAAVSRTIARWGLSDIGDALSDAVDTVGDVASDAVDTVGDVASDVVDTVGGVASDVVETVGDAASDAYEWGSEVVDDIAAGAQQLGGEFVEWARGVGSDIRDAITRLGAQAWALIAEIGTAAFEHLVRGGQLFLHWVASIPKRFWRIVVHLKDGLVGAVAWLSRAGGPILDAIQGVWSWVGGGVEGALRWLGDGLSSGARWAEAFLANPSFEGLVQGMLGMFDHLGAGLTGLARWGLDGLAAAATWIREGLPALGRWLLEGLKGGAAWAGEMILLLAEALGLGEALMFLWGIFFELRPLTGGEQGASETVHPAGLIPYGLVRVDEDGIIWRIAHHFEPGTLAVTAMHIISAPTGEMAGDLAAHELTHVGQYEAVGAVYMPEAIHAQHGAGYDYGDLTVARTEGKHFSDFNREQQAALCEAYYVVKTGGTAHYPATEAELDPFIAEMRAGDW